MEHYMELKKKKTISWQRAFTYTVIQNLVLCLGHFAVNPNVVTYAKFLGAGTTLTGFLAGMFFGVALAIRPVSGPMITKMDKRMLLIGVFALGFIAQIGYAAFPNLPMFVVFRILNGAQYSFVGSLIMTRVGDILPPEKMVSGMGIYGVGGAIGMSLAPAIGTWILNFGQTRYGELTGYRMMFLYAAVMMIIAIIPCLLSPPDKKKTPEELAAIGKWYKNIATVKAIPIAAVAFFSVMAYSVYNAYIYEFAKENGIGIQQASLFFSVLAIGLLVTRPVMGMITDKLGIKRVVIPGFVLFASSFIIVGYSKSLGIMLFAAAVAAIGYGSTQPTTQAMVVRVVPPVKRGVATNTYYVGVDLGFFLGPLIGGYVIEWVGNYGDMFKLFTIPAVIALILFAMVLPATMRQIDKVNK